MLQYRRFLLGMIFGILAGGACSDSSPTRPEAPAPASRIVFADPDALPEHREMITRLLEDTLRQAEGVIPVAGVQITVVADPVRAIQGWGIGGYASGSTEIEIAVDPGFGGLEQILPERLPPIAAHELHHTARWRGPGYGATLLEAMVSEGLADHFSIELLGSAVPPWSDAFPEDQTAFYLSRAAPELDSAAFDFNAWFFGPSMDLPRWTGYTLGFRLVQDYLDRHPGSSATSLVHASAEVFRPGG